MAAEHWRGGLDPDLQVVLGPARSGKSRWAEHLAGRCGLRVVVVATGPTLPGDEAWQRRLARHRQRRPADWQTLEVAAPDQLLPTLQALAVGQVALVDSLGSWVASALAQDDSHWDGLCQSLLSGLGQLRCSLILVSEQTGWGVVPATAIGGVFRDRLGLIERHLVDRAGVSWLVVAGRALNLTALGQVVPAD